MKLFSKWSLAIFVVAVVAHISQLSNQFTNWDDPEYITNNPRTQQITLPHLADILNPQMTSTDPFPEYQPLRDLSLALDWFVWGGKPLGFHLTNLLLHALNSLLLFYLLMGMFGNASVAGISAILFSIHPAHVESVAWAASRKDTLGFFFTLCTLFFFIQGEKNKNKKSKLASYVSYFLALFSKSHAVTTPFLLAIWFIWKKENPLKKLAPFLVIAFTYASYFLWVQFTTHPIQSYYSIGYEPNVVAMVRVFVLYVQMIFWPFHLSPYYDLGGQLKQVDALFYISLFVFLAFATLTIVGLKKRTRWGLALLLFFVQLLPVLNIIPHPIWLADRYIYFAAPFLYVAIAEVFLLIPNPFSKFAVVLCCCFLSILTWHQTAVWRNSQTLWTHVLSIYPRAYPALLNLGNQAIADKNWILADHYFTEAVTYRPRLPAAWLSGGIAKNRLGEYENAIRYYNEVLKREPNSVDAYFNMGMTYEEMKKISNASQAYAKCLEIKPTDSGCRQLYDRLRDRHNH